jgi:hypothetical protein
MIKKPTIYIASGSDDKAMAALNGYCQCQNDIGIDVVKISEFSSNADTILKIDNSAESGQSAINRLNILWQSLEQKLNPGDILVSFDSIRTKQNNWIEPNNKFEQFERRCDSIRYDNNIVCLAMLMTESNEKKVVYGYSEYRKKKVKFWYDDIERRDIFEQHDRIDAMTDAFMSALMKF